MQNGDRVRVLPYKRLRTIYNNSEAVPGKTFNMPGYSGVVFDIYQDTGGLSYVVESSPRRLPGGEWGVTYNEHSADELKPE
mgnify:FL=1